MKSSVGCLVVVVVVCCFVTLSEGQREEDRPRLMSGIFQERSANFIGSDFEWVQTSFEFDQKMYLSETFLASGAEDECPPLDCVACDFTDPQSTECVDSKCCGADQIKHPYLWCPSLPAPLSPSFFSSPPPPWHTFSLNEKSETFLLDAGEKLHGRFFIPEEYYCFPVFVAVRPQYGNFRFSLSPTEPLPNGSMPFLATDVKHDDNTLDSSTTSFVISPQWQYYKIGTYSLIIEAVESIAFEIEIQVSPLPFPFPRPSSPSISCDDWEEFRYGGGGGGGGVEAEAIPLDKRQILGGVRFEEEACLVEGRTRELTNPNDELSGEFHALVLPIEEGCHTISLAVTSEDTKADLDLWCLPIDPEQPVGPKNAAIARWNTRDDTLVFSACFPTPTFVHCGAQTWFKGVGTVIYSTKAPVLRTPVQEISPGTLTMMMGLNAIAPLREEPFSSICGNQRSDCWYSMLFAEEDPLVFWPPPQQNDWRPQFHFSPDLYSNLSTEFNGETVVFVDFSVKEGNRVVTTDAQLKGTRLSFMGLTNKEGLPPLFFPSGDPSLSSSSSSSSPPSSLPRSSFSPFPSIFEYVSWIGYEDLERRKQYCSREKYSEHQQYISELIQQIEGVSYEKAATLMYFIQTLNAKFVLYDCVDLITSTFPVRERTVFRTGMECMYEKYSEEWLEDPCCNIPLQSTQCCREKTVQLETREAIYSDQNLVVESCQTDECANSYVSDFIRAWNDQKDGVIGCPALSTVEIQNRIRKYTSFGLRKISDCLNYVGFGDNFEGVQCEVDADCLDSCNNITKLCSLPPLSEVEDLFVACFLEDTLSIFEDFLRRSFPSLAPHPISSPAFIENFKQIISKPDCISRSNPLDISKRAQYVVFGLNINRSNSEQTIPLTPVVPGAGEEAQSMVLSPEKGEEEAMVLGGGEMVEEVEAFIPGKDPEGEMIFVPEEEVVIPEDEEMMRGGEEEGMVLGGIFVPEEEVVVPEEEEMMRGGEEEGMVLGGVFVPEEEVAVPEEEEMMRGGEEEGMVLGGVFVPEEEVVVPEEEVVVPEEEEMMRGGEEEGMVLGGIFVPEEEVVVPEEEVVVPEEEEMMRGGEEEGMVLGGVFVPEEEMVVVGDKGGEEEEMALGGGMTLRGSIPEGEEEGGIVFVPEEEMVVPDKSSMVPDGEEVAPWEDEEGFMQSPGTLPSAETHVGHGDDGFEANPSIGPGGIRRGCNDQICLSKQLCRVSPDCPFFLIDLVDSSEQRCAAGGEGFMGEEGCGVCLSEEEALEGRCWEKEGVEGREECEELGGVCRLLRGEFSDGVTEEECWELEGECSVRCGDRPCQTREECEARSYCTDDLFLDSNEQGGCFYAGTIFSDLDPFTPIALSEDYVLSPMGYLLSNFTKEECTREAVLSRIPSILDTLVAFPNSGAAENPDDFPLTFLWVEKANTMEECYDHENRALGRYACDLLDTADSKKYLYNEEDCRCLAGSYVPVWEWVEGTWNTPQFLPYQWVTPPPRMFPEEKRELELVQPTIIRPEGNSIQEEALLLRGKGGNPYVWENALSFQLLEELMIEAFEEISVDVFLSTLTCQYNFTSAALDWVVCDCLGGEREDFDCYNNNEGSKVGQSRICKDVDTTLIVPSAQLIFDENSIKSGCLSVEVFLHSRDGYTYTIPNPAIALQFEDPRTFGAVVNDNRVTVGSLAGDGIEISFFGPTPPASSSSLSYLGSFELCLYARGRDSTWKEEFTVPDFALFLEKGEMVVLYVDIEEKEINGYPFWCTEMDNMEDLVAQSQSDIERESATIFPVWRQENAEEQSVHSDRAVTLAYVLSGCFLTLYLLYSALLLRNLIVSRTLLGAAVPVLFLCVCAIRGAFFILWAQGVLDDDEVAEYLLFETPTFLLMLLLLVFIHCWKSISLRQDRKRRFKYVPETILFLIIILIYIGTLIAAILIVDREEEEESPCPGRAPSDDSGLQDSLRILSITYMSVVTGLTFFLGAMMLFESREIFRMMSKGFIGAVFYVPASRFTFIFLVFFLVRCTILLFAYIYEITSDIFVFTLLMVCEVVPCSILWMEVTVSSIKNSQQSSTGTITSTTKRGDTVEL